MWPKRRALTFLPRVCILQKSLWTYDEINSYEPKKYFWKKSGANYQASIVQI
jgi:hypothetical protein